MTPYLLFRSLYWSRFGGLFRAAYYNAPKPPTDTDYWDSEVSGINERRLGRTLAVKNRNIMVANLIAQHHPAARSVLDFGCAGGTLCQSLGAIGITQYHGVDISAHSIQTARKWNSDCAIANFSQGTIEGYSEKGVAGTGLWDVIVISEVLYYLDLRRVRRVLVDAAKLLRPNGLFCISMNLHPQGRCFQREFSPALSYLSGFLWQEKVLMDDTVHADRARPLFHTFVARPAGRAGAESAGEVAVAPAVGAEAEGVEDWAAKPALHKSSTA